MTGQLVADGVGLASVRLAHARPGDALERRDGNSRHAIEIVAAIAAPSGEPAGFVDVTADPGRWK